MSGGHATLVRVPAAFTAHLSKVRGSVHVHAGLWMWLALGACSRPLGEDFARKFSTCAGVVRGGVIVSTVGRPLLALSLLACFRKAQNSQQQCAGTPPPGPGRRVWHALMALAHTQSPPHLALHSPGTSSGTLMTP